MRTWGSVAVSTNLTLACATVFQAFMWLMIRARRSAGGLSRKPTVRFTLLLPQYFAVSSARCMGCMTLLAIPCIIIWRAGAFAGLISAALVAAWIQEF